MKLKTILLIFFVCFALSVGCRWVNHWNREFKLVICDVGQGDAILIQSGDTQVLIDGGPDQSVMSCLGQHMISFDRVIELVIITHLDSDHIGGLIPVLSRYRVQRLMVGNESKETTDFKELDRLVQAKKKLGMEIIEPIHGTEITLGNTQKLRIINIFSENILQDSTIISLKSSASTNDRSIGTFLVCDWAKALLMADIEERVEQAIVNLGLLGDVNLLKVGHHGSKSSTSEALIRVTLPEISAISVGKNNRFDHPATQVINRLLEYNSSVLRTDQIGDLVFRCQGDHYHLE